MGAHKHNPTAIAAAEGKLPPKPPRKSKREQERELQAMIWQAMAEKAPEAMAAAMMIGAAGEKEYGDGSE